MPDVYTYIFHIHFYLSAPCAMHTRTGCPMQHYTGIYTLMKVLSKWQKDMRCIKYNKV